jgi:intracellular multiplication protein IcmO
MSSQADLFLPSDLMARHCLGIAATGGGKSNFLNLVLKQQMMRGGGVIHVDGKNNKDAIREFLTLAKQHNRWHDVRIINIDDPILSNTYNPLLRGDAEEITTRIMLLINSGGKDSFFRSQASKAVGAIIGLLCAMERPFNFSDLNAIFSSEGALRWLLREAPKNTEAYSKFKIFFDQLLEVDKRTGAPVINQKTFQHTFGDLTGKIAAYDRGSAGQVLNAYNPEVDLLHAIKENQLVYVALPMLSKAEVATDFAKIFLSDLRTAVGQLQNIPPEQRPNPTFLCLMDEFSSYAMPTLAALFEQARSANVCLFPFIQTVSSLSDKERGLSTDFALKILGNTWNKISFVLKDPESCKQMSEIAGQQLKEFVSQSYSENIGFASGNQDASMLLTSNRGRGYSKSTRVEYDAVARPEDFSNLKVGEGIYIGPRGVMRVRVPLIKLRKDGEDIDFPRFRMPPVVGIGLSDKYHQFSLTGGLPLEKLL